MNDRALPTVANAGVPALAMSEQEIMSVLQNSLYPGAKVESIKLVLGYCKASGLDPMQKPVHIVPISVKQGDNYVMRDVVMPGIGLYRTQASRTGEYAGVTEPIYGPTKELKSGTFTMEYPEWCRVTVKRQMDNGQIVEFTANERWLENYATAKRDTNMPNAMWKRRPFAQLAKCAEAQALRKAFPELGAAPTADEMEGKPFDDTEHQAVVIEQPRAKSKPTGDAQNRPESADASRGAGSPATESSAAPPPSEPAAPPTAPEAGAVAGPNKPMIPGQIRIVRAKLANAGLSESDLVGMFGPVESLQFDDFAKIQVWLSEKAA